MCDASARACAISSSMRSAGQSRSGTRRQSPCSAKLAGIHSGSRLAAVWETRGHERRIIWPQVGDRVSQVELKTKSSHVSACLHASGQPLHEHLALAVASVAVPCTDDGPEHGHFLRRLPEGRRRRSDWLSRQLGGETGARRLHVNKRSACACAPCQCRSARRRAGSAAARPPRSCQEAERGELAAVALLLGRARARRPHTCAPT